MQSGIRLLMHALAYNLFNWFRRLALAAGMRKRRIDTIRLKLLKITAKVVKPARYKYFKLHSSCPYKKEFYKTLENFRNLHPQLQWQQSVNLDNHNSYSNRP